MDKGRKLSKEHKERISIAMKGHKLSEEAKLKVSMSKIGKPRSEETKQKLSKAFKGEKSSRWKGGLTTNIKHRRERDKVNSQNRRARKKNNGGSFTLQEWKDLKKRYGNACPACGRQEPIVKLTIDHIVPISKGGSSNIGNIQPLCSICNIRKQTNIIAYEKTGQLRMVI